jgi:two-component system sensor histidine kinase KdpD
MSTRFPPSGKRVTAYGLSVLACIATTVLVTLVHDILDAANTVMIYLLAVFLVARFLGRGPAVVASFLSVALFDVIIVPPRFSLAVSDVQYLVTFAVMLAVGLVTANLTAGLQRQAVAARERELQAEGLYGLARELAGVIEIGQVAGPLERYMSGQGCQAELHLLDDAGSLPTLAPHLVQARFAALALQKGRPVEADTGAGQVCRVNPLRGATRDRGVLIVSAAHASVIDANLQMIDAVASVVALTVERLHYVEVAHSSQLEADAERLRNSVLSALSHDLRTPLTALVGTADALAANQADVGEKARGMAGAIRDQAQAMTRLLNNLLDMARLQAGKVRLNREWQLLEDVIGSSLQLMRSTLEGRAVRVALSPHMPLVEFDAVLIERVLCNLLENAAKYSAPGTPLEIRAFVESGCAGVAVCDRGQGFVAEDIDRVFGMFERGRAESPTSGVGLGLAICRSIMDAHGGRIEAANRDGGGACVTIRLPLGNPPAVEDEA